MPKDDLYYSVVKQGLIKLNWTITHDPYLLSFGSRRMYIDLGAEKIIGAQKGTKKIAVEIKSFLDPSPINDFHKAIGQYISYQTALKNTESDRQLFIAIPDRVYENFLQETFPKEVIKDYNIKIVIYNAELGELSKWLPEPN